MSNNDKYVGGWKDDEYEGEGTYTWQNGTNYTGQFKAGKMCGKGIFIKTCNTGKRVYANKNIYEGIWEDSCKHGSK